MITFRKLIITCRFLNHSTSPFETQLYAALYINQKETSYSDQPTISLYRASNMLSCSFWHGRTTSITKRGIKLTPMFAKLSFSNFLSAYSTGKFLCMMLFSVTLYIDKQKILYMKIQHKETTYLYIILMT